MSEPRLPELEILDVHVPASSLLYMNTPFTVTLNRPPEYVYEFANDDHTLIIGRDGIAYRNYTYGKPGMNPQWQAFGGRKFDITLADGTVVHAAGDWWSGHIFPDEQVTPCGYTWDGNPYRTCVGVELSTKALLTWMLRDRARGGTMTTQHSAFDRDLADMDAIAAGEATEAHGWHVHVGDDPVAF